MRSLGAPPKLKIQELKENYARPVLGLTECSQGVE